MPRSGHERIRYYDNTVTYTRQAHRKGSALYSVRNYLRNSVGHRTSGNDF